MSSSFNLSPYILLLHPIQLKYVETGFPIFPTTWIVSYFLKILVTSPVVSTCKLNALLQRSQYYPFPHHMIPSPSALPSFPFKFHNQTVSLDREGAIIPPKSPRPLLVCLSRHSCLLANWNDIKRILHE